MATIQAVRIDSNGFSENLAKKYCRFENEIDYTVNSGTGIVELYSNSFLNDFKIFKGTSSLKVTNSDYQNTDLVWSSPFASDSFSTTAPKNHFLSFYLLYDVGTINTQLTLEVFQDGLSINTYVFNLNSTSMLDTENWYRFGQNIYFDSGYNYTFKWTLKKDTASTETFKSIYIDGFAIQCLDNGDYNIDKYKEPKSISFETTETIDIPSIASNDSHTITATFLGALVGDYVQVVYPVELISLNLVIGYPLVTNSDEVSFIVHNHTGGSVNPTSGDFKFKIIR